MVVFLCVVCVCVFSLSKGSGVKEEIISITSSIGLQREKKEKNICLGCFSAPLDDEPG